MIKTDRAQNTTQSDRKWPNLTKINQNEPRKGQKYTLIIWLELTKNDQNETENDPVKSDLMENDQKQGNNLNRTWPNEQNLYIWTT